MKHLFLAAALFVALAAHAQSPTQQQYAEQLRQNNLLQQQGQVQGLSSLQIQQQQQNSAYSNALQQQQRAQLPQYAAQPSYSAPITLPQAYGPSVDYNRVASDLTLIIANEERIEARRRGFTD